MFALFALGATAAFADDPKYGGIYFNEAVEVDGVAYPAGSTIYAETWPTQMVVKPIVPEGKTFQWYSTTVPRATYINSRKSENSYYGSLNATFPVTRISKMDGTYLMTPPGDNTVVITNKAVCAYKVVYVATNGTDVATAGSEAEPFETIQYAVEYLYTNYKALNTMILVRPGVYNKGGYEGDANNFRSRVFVHADQHVLIKSTDGAEKTIIEGEIDPEGTGGHGDGARRCVTFQINAGGDACIQGFTFRKGRTAIKSGQSYLNQGGGIGAQRSNYGISQHIAADCVFTDCTAQYSAGAAWNMWLFRCHVIGGGAAALSYAYTSATLADGANAGGPGRLAWQSSGAGGFSLLTLNSVGGSQRLGPGGTYYGTVSTSKGMDGTNLGYTHATDYVVNLSAGDIRPVKGGAADFGSQVPEEGTDMWYLYSDVMAELACGDLYGNKVLWKDGIPMSGAIMETVQVRDVSLSLPKTVGLDASGFPGVELGKTTVSVKLPEGNSFTLAPNTNGTRYASAIVHNGVTNLFADLPGGIYSYTVSSGEGTLEFEVLMSTDWYVDDLGTAADSNKGFTPEFPKGTLAGAMNVATSGDTIHALPGSYSVGTMRNSMNKDYYMQSRVVVKAGVTLESTEGPEKTIIFGAKATPEGGPVNDYGCGSNAVRCAYVTSTGKLRGFTLTGGRVNHIGGDYDDVSNGGGVRGDYGGTAPKATVEDCIISNNVARIGGAGHWVRFVRCRLFDNYAVGREALGWYNAFIDTIAASNHSANGTASFRYGEVINSTFGQEFKLDDTTHSTAFYESLGGQTFANNIIKGYVNYSGTKHTAVNCLLPGGTNLTKQDCPTATWDELLLGDGFKPSKGSPAVDAGVTDRGFSGETDALGGQRVYNGTVDIGAVEYDWRGDYAKDIAKREVVVSAADPQVVEREGKVTLDPGATLTAEWTPSGTSARCDVKVSVTGTGALTVSVGGAAIGTVTAADSPKTFNFGGAIGETSKILFAYSQVEDDEGCAVIEKIGLQKGFLLLVR